MADILHRVGINSSLDEVLRDRGKPSGYAYYFDFNEGKSNDDQKGYALYKHALCVRGSGIMMRLQAASGRPVDALAVLRVAVPPDI